MSLTMAILLLSVWGFLMHRYGRSILFPPALLTLVWTATFLVLLLCGDMYYPITRSTVFIAFAGIIAFSIGGLLAIRLPRNRSFHLDKVSRMRITSIRRFLRWVPLILVLNFPFFLAYLGELSSTIAPREGIWRQIRMASIHANATGGGIHIESSILPLISFAALLAVFEWTETRQDGRYALATFVLAALYHLLNGSRSDILLLLVSAVTIYWVRSGTPPKKALLTAVLGFGLVFIVNQVAMGKFGADSNASIGENVPKVIEGVTTYWLGGIVAFDQFCQNPKLKYGWDLNAFAIRIANKLGASFLQHNRDLEYTKVSVTQVTNVYSIFLPYYMQTDSIAGVVYLMFAVGLLSTYTYRCAIGGSCWAVFILGALIFSTLMTFFSDEFFAQITFMLKMALFSTSVYFLPPLKSFHMRGEDQLRVPGNPVCG
jgi:oligosaccharide repeat unit polymerase